MENGMKLIKTPDMLSFMITLFGVLQDKSSDKIVSYDGNKVFISKKPEAEIINLKLDYTDLKNKIFDWIDNRKAVILELTNEETNILNEIAHAVYYFITESENKKGTWDKFIAIYNNNFKKNHN